MEPDSSKCTQSCDDSSSLTQPVCGLSGVGEAEDGTELHTQDEVEDEEGLIAQCGGHIILLQTQSSSCHLQSSTNLFYSTFMFISTSYRQALGEAEAAHAVSRGRCGV